MNKLTFKETIAFNFLFNERRVYHRWYGRWFLFGLDYGRLRRVIPRIANWFQWCREWDNEGEHVENLADDALRAGHLISARILFHQAVACYHVGQHIFFIDPHQKELTQEKARRAYAKAIALYPNKQRPVPLAIPFQRTIIPGYLHRAARSDAPLILYINGMDNIKEAENHFFGQSAVQNGFHFLAFDGPGQGEMWSNMKFDVNGYVAAVKTVVDWLHRHHKDMGIVPGPIATAGFSLGGHLAPLYAAHDRRIVCSVGNSGFAKIGGVKGARKLNPIWQRGITYMTGCDRFERAVLHFDLDITKAPALDRPLLFFHAGKDEVMPSPRQQADMFMQWATGEKELRFFPESEHCTVDRLDEVFPYILDWLSTHMGAQNRTCQNAANEYKGGC